MELLSYHRFSHDDGIQNENGYEATIFFGSYWYTTKNWQILRLNIASLTSFHLKEVLHAINGTESSFLNVSFRER